jgi:glycosyltransferase involved in cell wall biosynthesis
MNSNQDINLSVIMSAYNSQKFIGEAIKSILRQSYDKFELIIIDDGSEDDTVGVISSFDDRRIKLISNERNKGLATSLNIGIEQTVGKYIIRMDADDIALPNRFQEQLKFMEEHREIDVCGSWYELFSTVNETVKTPLKDRDIKDTLFFNNCIAHPSVIIKRNSLEKYAIRYDENLRFAQDYELWCREVDRLRFANIPEILLKYRIHGDQIGVAKKEEQNLAANRVRINNLKKVGIELSLEESLIYLGSLANNYNFDSVKQIKKACAIFDRIGNAGKQNGYGDKFDEMITGYLSNIADKGLQLGKTSVLLWLSVFRKWKIFKTKRAKIRYLYYSLRNILND